MRLLDSPSVFNSTYPVNREKEEGRLQPLKRAQQSSLLLFLG